MKHQSDQPIRKLDAWYAGFPLMPENRHYVEGQRDLAACSRR